MTTALTTTSSSTRQLRQLYKSATSSFLVRDYDQTAQSISTAFNAIHHDTAITANNQDWIECTGKNEPVPTAWDMSRKFQILRATFLATILSANTPSGSQPASIKAFPQDISELAMMPAQALLTKLWHLALENQSGSAVNAHEGEGEGIFPTTSAANVHPSIPIALAFAALKLDEPRLSRQVLEAWFGSTSDELERIIWEQASSETLDWLQEYPVSAGSDSRNDDVAAGGVGGLSSSMTASGVLPAKDKPSQARQLLTTWIKAFDLLTLHVLPTLGEWEAAGDFIRLQGVDNGGIVPDVRVEAAIAHLNLLQQQDLEASALRLERQRQLEARSRASYQKPTPPLPAKSTRKDKGKERATATTTAQPSSSSDKRRPRSSGSSGTSSSSLSPSSKANKLLAGESSSAVGSSGSGTTVLSTRGDGRSGEQTGAASGFAALRSTLSSFLSRNHHDARQSGSHSGVIRTGTGSVWSLVQTLQDDPLRLLSAVCLFVAFTSWIRRRRRMGLRSMPGLGDVGHGVWNAVVKVGEAVKMGTTVTQL